MYLERIIGHLSHHHDISVLTFKHDASLPVSDQSGRINIVRMPYAFRVSKGFISPQSLWYFAKGLRGASAVVVNVPNAEALALVIMARLLGKKIIAVYHCDIDLGPGILSRIVKAVLDMSISAQLRLADHIVACPDYIEQRPFYKSFEEKIVATIPPIETARADVGYLKELQVEKSQTVWVGFVGRIAREKGIEYLIGAMETINTKNVRLIIVSPKETIGERPYHTRVMNLLKNSTISYKVLSSLSSTKLAALYESLDVLVLPSVNPTEAFGMVQAEAMLRGTPVVATDQPGVRLPVRLTGAGVLVPRADPSQLARAIKKVIDTKFRRGDIKKKSETAFDPRNVYSLYDKLLLGNQ